ncbi:MAG: PaaI family thioesterase [Novosphingobium sp.]|nr:PaaI family thioesterase [Novosphingobium sp.]
MAADETSEFIHRPDPDNPGWLSWNLADKTRFQPQVMGDMLVRPEGERSARLRMFPQVHHTNARGTVHGGVTMSLLDMALFATFATVLEGDAERAVTLDMATQFIGAGQLGKPLDAVTEVLRETGRLAFMRGLVEQDGTLIASYSATIRKPSAPR